MRPFLHLLHLAGVIIWVGGMFFAHFCLRPVAATQLPVPQRLTLLAAVLGRFFAAVAVCSVAILGSGLAIMISTGMANAPLHWHLMLAMGLGMMVVFAIIYRVHYPRMKTAVAAEEWPTAGAAANSIRLLVAINLALGAATVAVASVGFLF